MKSITPFLVIVISFAMYFLYISPAVNEVRSLGVTKAEYTTVLEKTRELKEKRDAILADYNNIPSTDIEKLNKVIPDKFDATLFTNDVNTWATQFKIKILNIKESETTTESRNDIVVTDQGKNFKTNIVTLRVSGGYKDFEEFLNNIETSLRLVDVVSLTVKYMPGQKASENSYEFGLELNIYSLR